MRKQRGRALRTADDREAGRRETMRKSSGRASSAVAFERRRFGSKPNALPFLRAASGVRHTVSTGRPSHFADWFGCGTWQTPGSRSLEMRMRTPEPCTYYSEFDSLSSHDSGT